jgi:hypothetical protein
MVVEQRIRGFFETGWAVAAMLQMTPLLHTVETARFTRRIHFHGIIALCVLCVPGFDSVISLLPAGDRHRLAGIANNRVCM